MPNYDFAMSHKKLAYENMEAHYPCCGKSICRGCVYSFGQSGNEGKYQFCNSDRSDKTDEEKIHEMMKRAEANDAASIYMLANSYDNGRVGLQQDHAKAMELYVRAAELGCSQAHCNLGMLYHEGGNLKKAKFHYEAAAMAGCEDARYNLATCERELGNMDRAVKHLKIGASAGDPRAMHNLLVASKKGYVSRKSVDSTLDAYNNFCAEVRSEARDAYMRRFY